jgi:magnesium-transporting ATPase (P-type)
MVMCTDNVIQQRCLCCSAHVFIFILIMITSVLPSMNNNIQKCCWWRTTKCLDVLLLRHNLYRCLMRLYCLLLCLLLCYCKQMRELKSGLKIGPNTYDLVIAALAHAGEHEQVSYCCS